MKPNAKIRACLYHPVIQGEAKDLRSPEAALEEAAGLALAIDLNIVTAEIVNIKLPKPSTMFGGGKVDEINAFIKAQTHKPKVVIVNGSLTPVQHRNLEEEWGVKVLDRTALILEIFGARAQTKEGRLQVALAHLTYQKSRLVRSWTHLERQRGGAGFLGGPGERQIESDRRQLQEKIDKLKKQIEQVIRTRHLQRVQRKKAPYPVIALVGYTNAGKSTLFNYLTKSDVFAKDLLFATLDPTMRAVILPSQTKIIFSDTVGFISDLPTQLIAAFRATLEEVNEADIILHVRDSNHPDTEQQRIDVLDVLTELGIDDSDARPVIEVFNKIDAMEIDAVEALHNQTHWMQEHASGSLSDPYGVAISALQGQGIDDLSNEIDRVLTMDYIAYQVVMPLSEGQAISWLHANGDVTDEEYFDADQTACLTVRLSDKAYGQFQKQFAKFPLVAVDDINQGTADIFQLQD